MNAAWKTIQRGSCGCFGSRVKRATTGSETVRGELQGSARVVQYDYRNSLVRRLRSKRERVHSVMAALFIFAGLPGTGKTTLSQQLARRIPAVHIRIDTLEQGLRDLCNLQVEGEGYRLGYRIAADNLALGMDVVADSCNPLELTRREWEQVSRNAGAEFINIEVICSDAREHRRRIESRVSNIAGLQLPTWSDVEHREYDRWSKDRIIIDTAGRSESQCVHALLSALGRETAL